MTENVKYQLHSSSSRRLALMGALGVVSILLAYGQHMGAFNRAGQAWGTFAWRTTVGPGFSSPALVTFSADGTVIGSDGTMFGGMPITATLASPFHGAWVRTNWRNVAGTSLWLVFDTAGVRIAWGRSRSSLEFALNFDSLEGKMFIETLPCPTPLTCPDPTNSAAKWVPVPNMPADGFSVTATRVEPVKAGPLP